MLVQLLPLPIIASRIDNSIVGVEVQNGNSCITRLREAGRRLWPDDREHPLPSSGSSLAAADLCVAGLRPVSELPGASALPGVLAQVARGRPSFGDGGAFQDDQARR